MRSSTSWGLLATSLLVLGPRVAAAEVAYGDVTHPISLQILPRPIHTLAPAGSILLSKYRDDRGFWYVTPGGGQQAGE